VSHRATTSARAPASSPAAAASRARGRRRSIGGVSSCCCQGVDELFGERTAQHDLRRYRKRGPSRSTRALLDALRAEGVAGATLLDVGGGVGVIQHELLHAGAASATGVEASAAYIRAAREEAERRGHAERISHREGDFVALADGVAPADVVTLDRVICCYPDMESLVGRSAERARRLYGLVYPRDRWWVATGIRLTNVFMRVSRRAYRAYLHRPSAVDAVAREHGLTPRLSRPAGPFWQIALYARETR
jgi:Methyltransferase domain